MNLVEAFREIGPVEGDLTAVARRRQAATLIFEELQSFAARVWKSIDEADRRDVASEVLIRLMNNGPRGGRADNPTTDAAVRAYLHVAIKNGLQDVLRRRGHLDRLGDSEPIEDSSPGPDDQASHAEAKGVLDWARYELFEVILPQVASHMRAGAKLVETVHQLREIHAGRLSINQLILLGEGPNLPPEEHPRARNRLDQRFSRAFARIHQEIERLERDGAFPPHQIHALRTAMDELRLRQ
jgi:DNA-directed RNA polymerase specialized sigma24 family protein